MSEARCVTRICRINITASSHEIVYDVNIFIPELWDQYVGEVSTYSTNTTVEPVPVPSESLTPPPPLYYPQAPFPSEAQVPLQARNKSWRFPEGFWRGVSGSAFQVEGAVKDEGRGPSIWDVLTRVPDLIKNNEVADIADNHYYQYKQGELQCMTS